MKAILLKAALFIVFSLACIFLGEFAAQQVLTMEPNSWNATLVLSAIGSPTIFGFTFAVLYVLSFFIFEDNQQQEAKALFFWVTPLSLLFLGLIDPSELLWKVLQTILVTLVLSVLTLWLLRMFKTQGLHSITY